MGVSLRGHRPFVGIYRDTEGFGGYIQRDLAAILRCRIYRLGLYCIFLLEFIR